MIDRLSDMLSMIWQKNDGAATMRINPKGVGICRRLLNSCNPLGHSTILIDGI
jgi:hypothetical protein